MPGKEKVKINSINDLSAEIFLHLKNREYIFVGKNKIYFEDYGDKPYFCVEKFEYTNTKGVDMFSVVDGYHLLTDAIEAAKKAKSDYIITKEG